MWDGEWVLFVTEDIFLGGKTTDISAGEQSRILRTEAYDREMPPDTVPDDLNISIEFLEYTPASISLLFTNNSGCDLSCSDAYMITGKTFGAMSVGDGIGFTLPAGESREIVITPPGTADFSLGFGEFRLTTEIVVGPNNASSAKAYTNVYRLYADFAIDNTEIPDYLSGIYVEVDFATPIGALINVTNGFENGRLYFDKAYRLQEYADGIWRDIPVIGSDVFPDEVMQSLAPRQVLQYHTVYWEWLYGELSSGRYRMEKCFWYRANNGGISEFVQYIEFSLDGDPIPNEINRGDSTWDNPFSGIGTFSAEVLQFVDRYEHQLWGPGVLVESLTPLWDGDKAGGRYYVWENSTLTVLNSEGRQIIFSDIEQNAVVDITFSGIVLTSDPTHIPNTLVIRIVR